MTPPLGGQGAVELLERALAYTRPALAAVRPAHLWLPTPCERWDLDDLLWHMDDALDVFAEAATGALPAASHPARRSSLADRRPRGVEARLRRLRDKACHLLGVWAELPDAPVLLPPPSGAPPVTGSPTLLAAPLVAATAAVEITVHGWDVGQATGAGRSIPPDLASGLLPVAAAVVEPRDQDGRFGPVVPIGPGAPAPARLLAHLGRDVRLAV